MSLSAVHFINSSRVAYIKTPGVTLMVGLRVLERLMEMFLEPLSEPF